MYVYVYAYMCIYCIYPGILNDPASAGTESIFGTSITTHEKEVAATKVFLFTHVFIYTYSYNLYLHIYSTEREREGEREREREKEGENGRESERD